MLVCLEALEGAELVLVDLLFAFVLRPGQGALFESLANYTTYCNIAASSPMVKEHKPKRVPISQFAFIHIFGTTNNC